MQKDYEVIQEIGKGSFGVVKKVRRLKDSKLLVAKEMRYGQMSSRQKQQLVAQVNILKDLDHPNIVKYYDRIVDRKQLTVFIIMQYCQGGDLGTLIKQAKKNKDFIHQSIIWKIFTQFIEALHFCHFRKQGKIMHRDIKPANIFIDANSNIKLGDFGLSRQMGQYSQFAQSHVGTPYYMSPQQINEQRYNEKSDIWSAGCLLYQMAALRRPFQANNSLALACKIQKGYFERIPSFYSQNLQNLIQSMLQTNPLKRKSTSEILMVPMIKVRIENNRIEKAYSQLVVRQQAAKSRQAKLRAQKAMLLENSQQKENLQRVNI